MTGNNPTKLEFDGYRDDLKRFPNEALALQIGRDYWQCIGQKNEVVWYFRTGPIIPHPNPGYSDYHVVDLDIFLIAFLIQSGVEVYSFPLGYVQTPNDDVLDELKAGPSAELPIGGMAGWGEGHPSDRQTPSPVSESNS